MKNEPFQGVLPCNAQCQERTGPDCSARINTPQDLQCFCPAVMRVWEHSHARSISRLSHLNSRSSVGKRLITLLQDTTTRYRVRTLYDTGQTNH